MATNLKFGLLLPHFGEYASMAVMPFTSIDKSRAAAVRA